MIPQANCYHSSLQFGSGDHFIFCVDCGLSWRIEEQPSFGTGESKQQSNIGVGSTLSGQFRVVAANN